MAAARRRNVVFSVGSCEQPVLVEKVECLAETQIERSTIRLENGFDRSSGISPLFHEGAQCFYLISATGKCFGCGVVGSRQPKRMCEKSEISEKRCFWLARTGVPGRRPSNQELGNSGIG
jgi:hypothetical protein